MTAIVGILNVTPDSFAEARPTTHPAHAVERAANLIADGADVVDVGAESTRPGARALTPREEWERLGPCLPQIVGVARGAGVAVSLDTRHADTAARAIDCGVDWINAVDGVNDAMAAVLARSTCKVVVMHAVTVPVVRGQTLPPDLDVLAYLEDYLQKRLQDLDASGVSRDRVIFDPGVGFGTTPRQSIAIIAGWQALKSLGQPILIGHSRKSFLSLFTDAAAPDRDDVTLALSGALIAAGLDYLRVHDVARHATLRHAILA